MAIKKVWIEEGCIICDACEDACPSVFKVVKDVSCEVIGGINPSEHEDGILDAAEACPVKVIQYEEE
jgi:ferredoxin